MTPSEREQFIAGIAAKSDDQYQGAIAELERFLAANSLVDAAAAKSVEQYQEAIAKMHPELQRKDQSNLEAVLSQLEGFVASNGQDPRLVAAIETTRTKLGIVNEALDRLFAWKLSEDPWIALYSARNPVEYNKALQAVTPEQLAKEKAEVERDASLHLYNRGEQGRLDLEKKLYLINEAQALRA